MKNYFSLLTFAILLSSCQKELVDSTTGSGTGSGSGGGSPTSNGDLFVKGVSITGTDTAVLNLKWDSNKRLIQYLISGKTNGVATNSRIDITRESNGNIKKMFAIPLIGGGYIDSVVTYVNYQSGTSKIIYIKDINYSSILGQYSDSSIFTYNSAGRISVKETYMQNFLTGVYEKQSKGNYTYDAQGNLITDVTSVPDAGGNYSVSSTITDTYDSHLAPATIGDDAFVITVLGDDAVSPNNVIKKVQASTAATYTFIVSNQQFNTLNRPTSGTISFTPVPPGYALNYTYTYQ